MLKANRVSDQTIPQLVFKSIPATVDEPVGELDDSNPNNAPFLSYEKWLLCEISTHQGLPLVNDKEANSRLSAEMRDMETEVHRLGRMRTKAWERQIFEHVLGLYSTSQFKVIRPPQGIITRASMSKYLLAGLLMATILHTLASVSFPRADYLLATLRVLLFGAFTANHAHPIPTSVTATQRSLVDAIPLDIRTAMKDLYLEPEITTYATCPTCSFVYLPRHQQPDDPFPHYCTNEETDKGVCGALLVKEVKIKPKKKRDPIRVVYRPLRPYPYHALKSWIAEFLLRPGIESVIKKRPSRPPSPSCRDIRDAPLIRDFMHPDGSRLFSDAREGEVHLTFSMFIDWFNPYGNKKAGKSHSIGVIYLACLDLPPDIRYRVENICLVGVIPGPKEPHLHEINYFLRPLIDELLELWEPGVRFEQTAMRDAGCLVRVAIIPLVCDVPAMRKTAGFASHSSAHFCSFCPLPLRDMSNIDRSTWPTSLTWDQHLTKAWNWRDAATEKDRHIAFDNHGIRWSELLRLPYWDPTRYAVLDAMHNLFLGELAHHCRGVWGADVVRDKVHLVSHTPAEQQRQLLRVQTALTSSAPEAKLMEIRKDYLSAVARFNQLVGVTSTEPTKRDYARAFVEWTAKPNNVATELLLPPALPEPATRYRLPYDEVPQEPSQYHVFTSEVLRHLRADIPVTTIPSWIEMAPANFGTAGFGKLKADLWRTICTINMVITLGRLWGSQGSSAEEAGAFENFAHLICAVELATRRSMNPERAKAYDFHMEQYLQGLRRLYNHALVPNHHLALHLRPFLEGFGPVHGWWAFPFERYNGILQRLKTNSKPGTLSARASIVSY
uniref:SPI-1 type III secretion system export apparatus protein SpaS (Secretory protein (Associated with virulence)) (Virulence-associated secretory protein) n=1 Tax=Ganoderma boninense TaxID=34458 RepID=A0A5K1JYG7_9APHY|nr:SPI-1 type III secretion system export apparatus protein SpaS (Secretory protein (Associated with virulence)) (Virulence-associated secretory protein) [Ganoderma boninense]